MPALVVEGIDYAEGVKAGAIPAGKYVVLACSRFLRDLRDASKQSSRWVFDAEKAHLPIRAAELMPNIKGPDAGKPLRFMPFQKWIMANIFGFVSRETGWRRFRQASIWVPRGNGKTSMMAPTAIYLSFLEGEGGAEGYAAAVTREQARILWDTAKEMVRRTPALRARFGVETAQKTIYQMRSASKLVPVSSDAKSLDGLNVHVAVCDEIGSHKTSAVYSVLLTALGKRSQPLLISISTATGNNAGIGKQIHDYTVRVLERVVEDEAFFGVIYAADIDDPIWEEATWRKANPGWGHTVQPEAIRAIATQARSSPAQEIAFKTRHLNLWVSSDSSLFLMDAWHQCAVPGLNIEDFEGRPCFVGLDLANKIDLASMAIVFPEANADGTTTFTIFTQSWLPEETVEKSRNASYPEWAATGALTVTEGEVTDYDAIEEAIREVYRRFDVQGIGYDPWGAKQLASRLGNEGLPMMEVRMTMQNMSEPTKSFDALMRARRIRHNGSAVLTWAVSCVVGRLDEKGNVFPKKSKNTDDKIDPAIATIIALALAENPEHARIVVTEPLVLI
jgi:phage terminase large subunit-like protein